MSDSTDAPPFPIGCLRSVEVINFMRHEHLQIDLKPHVNFITGRNGSGKSSILVAIAVGLGSNSRRAGRGSNLAELIKTGKTEATIIVSIQNGPSGYKFDQYGDVIVVTRKITKSGTRFDIRGQPRSAVAGAVTDELNRIRSFFNIQVDNPCSIMHQDIAREFIGTSSPEKKYELFMRGTLLSKLTEEIADIRKNLQRVSNSQSEKLDEKQQLDESFARQKRLNDIVEEADDLLERIHDLEDELAWAHYRTAEDAAVAAEEQLSDVAQRMENTTNTVSEKRMAFAAARADFDRAKQKMTEELARLSGIQHEKDALTASLGKVRAEIGSQRLQMQNNCARIETLKRDLEAKRADHAKLERRRATAADDAQRRRDHFIAEREEQQAQFSRELESVVGELARITEELRACSADNEQLRQSARETDQALSATSNKLRSLKGVYAAGQSDSLIGRIRKERRFTFQPIGPLSRVVTLSDRRWGVACQIIVGKSLNLFLVNTMDDERMLRSMIGKENISIAVVEFAQPRYPPTGREPPVHGARTVLDMLTIAGEQITGRTGAVIRTEDVISNVLMDVYNADRVWCIEDEELAKQVAFRGDGITTIAPSGIQFKVQDGVQALLGATNAVCKIGVDESHRIAQLEREEARLQADREAIARQARAAEAGFRDLKSRKSQFEKRRSELTNKLNRVTVELENPPDELDNFDNQLESVASRIHKIESEIDAKEGNIPEIEARIAALQNDKKRSMEKIQELSARLTSTDGQKEESDRLFAEQRNAERELERAKQALAALTDKHTRLQEAARAARVLADETLEKARRHSPLAEERFREGTRSPRSLAVLLQEEKAKYEEAQKLHGLDFNRVRQDYLKAKTDVDRAVRYLRELGEFIERAEDAIRLRVAKLQQIQHSITRRAKVSFLQYQKQRKYVGKLKFSHENKAIQIFVKSSTDQQFTEVASLSGGEKSFCLVSLLLSLWEVMECPFYCVDEFDVFMDDINRQAATTLLIRGATTMDNHQFIYLTPLSLDTVKHDDRCTIFEVVDDR